ncbi:MAG TPA: hypothetical protein VHE99_06435 [Gammaproteobacteria bacterium]|nr:hypothetical protein [Gammaproteobacteria bacterium]
MIEAKVKEIELNLVSISDKKELQLPKDSTTTDEKTTSQILSSPTHLPAAPPRIEVLTSKELPPPPSSIPASQPHVRPKEKKKITLEDFSKKDATEIYLSALQHTRNARKTSDPLQRQAHSDKAFCAYQIAAYDRGHARAQLALGLWHFFGEFHDRDLNAAAALFELSADQGNTRAQRFLNSCYQEQMLAADQHQSQGDAKEAVDIYWELADKKHAPAIHALVNGFLKKKFVLTEDRDRNFIELCKTAARQKNPLACEALGCYYYYGGYGVQKNKALSLDYYALATELQTNSEYSASVIAECYFTGSAEWRVKKDLKKAAHFYQLAIARGEITPIIQYRLAHCYLYEEGIKDAKAAEQLLVAAYDMLKTQDTHHDNQILKANILSKLGKCCEEKQALKHYEQAQAIFKELNLPTDQQRLHYHLGNCYEKLGKYGSAINHYQLYLYPPLVSTKWLATIHLKIGDLFIELDKKTKAEKLKSGQTVLKHDVNLTAAFQQYQQADRMHSDIKSKNALGFCYLNGVGVKRNTLMAEKYFKQSAECHCPIGQYQYGLLFWHGTNRTHKNLSEALRWFTLSAQQGHMDSIKALAECYEIGLGVNLDKKLASNLLQLKNLGTAIVRERIKTLLPMSISSPAGITITTSSQSAPITTSADTKKLPLNIITSDRQNFANFDLGNWWKDLEEEQTKKNYPTSKPDEIKRNKSTPKSKEAGSAFTEMTEISDVRLPADFHILGEYHQSKAVEAKEGKIPLDTTHLRMAQDYFAKAGTVLPTDFNEPFRLFSNSQSTSSPDTSVSAAMSSSASISVMSTSDPISSSPKK